MSLNLSKTGRLRRYISFIAPYCISYFVFLSVCCVYVCLSAVARAWNKHFICSFIHYIVWSHRVLELIWRHMKCGVLIHKMFYNDFRNWLSTNAVIWFVDNDRRGEVSSCHPEESLTSPGRIFRTTSAGEETGRPAAVVPATVLGLGGRRRERTDWTRIEYVACFVVCLRPE